MLKNVHKHFLLKATKETNMSHNRPKEKEEEEFIVLLMAGWNKYHPWLAMIAFSGESLWPLQWKISRS